MRTNNKNNKNQTRTDSFLLHTGTFFFVLCPTCLSTFCFWSRHLQKGKTQNEEEAMQQKLGGMEAELSSLEQDVQRHEERQEKQDKVGGCFVF